jgi:hypothetical protein
MSTIVKVPNNTSIDYDFIAFSFKGKHSFEDFGIYRNDAGQFMSNAMFYNGGTALNEVFGICKQVSTDASLPMA